MWVFLEGGIIVPTTRSNLDIYFKIKTIYRTFPVVQWLKTSPYNAGDVSLIPDQRTKISHPTGQLSPHAETTLLSPWALKLECHNQRSCALQRKIPHDATKISHATTKI